MSDDQGKALHQERLATIGAVGNVTLVWATIESSLAAIFSILMSGKRFDECAGVVFYTPTNTEARISLVSNLVRYRCEFRRKQQNVLDAALSREWKSVRRRLRTIQGTRNLIVHGIHVTGGGPSGPFVGITPAFGDALRMDSARPSTRPIGSAKINDHVGEAWTLNDRISKLGDAFALRMKLRDSPWPTDLVEQILGILGEVENLREKLPDAETDHERGE